MKNFKKGLLAEGSAKSNQGFTLIELLVVITIIGLLASVILASTNSARTKGEDAKIISNIKTIQTQSAIYFDDNNSFYSSNGTVWQGSSTTCNTASTYMVDPVIARALTEIFNNNSGTKMCNYGTNTGAQGYVTSWAMVLPLKNQANTYWCLDSTGVSRRTHANGTAYNAVTGSAPAALTNNADLACN